MDAPSLEIQKELAQQIVAKEGFMAVVFEGLADKKTPQQIARKVGHKNAMTTIIFKNAIEALFSMQKVQELAKDSLKHFTIAKNKIVNDPKSSVELKAYLEEISKTAPAKNSATYSNSAQKQAYEGASKDKHTWLAGAAGERRVKEELGKLQKAFPEDQFIILHDLSIPGSKANLDHVVITPAGVYYIDAKHYADKKIHFSIEGSTIGKLINFAKGDSLGTKHLTIGGRISDTTIEPFYWELEKLQEALPETVGLNGMLCFVNGLWESANPLGDAWVDSGWFNLKENVTVTSPNLLKKFLKIKTKEEPIDVLVMRDLILEKFPQIN